MDEVRGIVVTHARLGAALVEAAEEISGIEGALTALSNRGRTPDQLCDDIATAVGRGPAIVFVDLAAGSCGFASRAAQRVCGASAVVTGVNLPMLLDFLFHRELDPSELSARLVEQGRANISVAGTESRDDAARPVPD